MKDSIKLLIPGLIVCIILAFIFNYILNALNFGLPFIVPIIEGAIVGLVLVFLLRFTPKLTANKFWILVAIFALTMYLVPHYLDYLAVVDVIRADPELGLYADRFSFIDYFELASNLGTDFGRVTSSSSFHLDGIGYWFMQLVEIALYGFGIIYGLQKVAKHNESNLK